MLFASPFVTKKSLFRFVILVLCSQAAFSVLAMKGVLLPQMLELWSISKTQFGILMSIYGTTHTVLYLALSWAQDRYSSKILISVSMIMGGVTTFFLGVVTDFEALCFLFLMLAIWCEGAFWPAVLTAVRRSAKNEHQSIIFGLFEGGRGCIELLQNALTLSLYTTFAYSVLGLQVAFKFNAVLMVILGISSWFTLPDEALLKSTDRAGRTKEVIEGMNLSISLPSIWLAGFTGFCIYCIYTTLPFYVTFLTESYAVPIISVSIFSIVATSGGRIGAALPAGFVAKKFFSNATGAIKSSLFFVLLLCATLALVPHEFASWWFSMIVLAIMIILVFFMRALYFAPFGEMGIPPRFSGSTIALAAFVIYLPSSFAYFFWGYLLDSYDNTQGYRVLFIVLSGVAALGIVACHRLQLTIRAGVSALIEEKVSIIDEKLELQGVEKNFDDYVRSRESGRLSSQSHRQLVSRR